MDPNSVRVGGGFLNRLAWKSLRPARLYVRKFPNRKGSGFLYHRILDPLIPKGDSSFEVRLPDGTVMALHFRDILARSVLIEGDFEPVERRVLAEFATPGTVAIDVGANIGVFSVGLGKALGEQGRVIAIEPLDANAEALTDNIRLNHLSNVDVLVAAASDRAGMAELRVADDPAFHSMHALASGTMQTSKVVHVPTLRLDDVWRERGSPDVSVIKIDVEGAELDVLRGAQELLRACRPVLMLEANTSVQLARQQEYLLGFHYQAEHPQGFLPWNHLFVRSS